MSKQKLSLSDAERTIIEFASVCFDSETVTNIVRCLAKMGCRIDNRPATTHNVRPLLDRLAKARLLTEEHTVSAERAHAVMLELSASDRLNRIAAIARELRPATTEPYQPISTWRLAQRELRIALYTEQWKDAAELAKSHPRQIFYDVCRPFDQAWVSRFPSEIRKVALAGIVQSSLSVLEPAQEAFTMFEAESDLDDRQHRVFVEQLIFRGRFDDAERQLAGRDSSESKVSRAFLLFLRGHFAEAISAYETALGQYLKMAGKRATFFPDRAGFFFLLALLAEGSAQSLARAAALADAAAHAKSVHFTETHSALIELLEILQGRRDPEDVLYLTTSFDLPKHDLIEILVQAAAIIWAQVPKAERPPKLKAELAKRQAAAHAAGYHWYATQAAAVLARYDSPVLNTDASEDEETPKEKVREAKASPAPASGVNLATLVSPRERWSEAIDALLESVAPKARKKTAKSPPASDRRLVWIVSVQSWGGFDIKPREQTMSKGGWSKGKPVALKRLFEDARSFPFLTDADRAACATITSETSYHGGYPDVGYYLDKGPALLALANGGVVLIEGPQGSVEPCEIRQVTPRLEVKKQGKQVSIALDPRPVSDEDTMTSRVVGNRSVEVIEFSPIHHAIARALGKKPLIVPKEGQARLQTALHALSGQVVVHSDLSDEAGDVEAVRGETRPCFLLRPVGDGLGAAAHVRPLGPDGPLVRPGRGGKTLLAQVRGSPARALRNHEEERQRLEHVLTGCPTLSSSQNGEADFMLSTSEKALEALAELQALGSEVAIEWPDGGSFQLSHPLGLENLQVSVTTQPGAFLVRGELTLPDHAPLPLAELIDYLSASPGRFLHLANEERYFTLTAEFRARLDELLNLGERSKRGVRFHTLVAPLVAELLASARIESDAVWREQIERFAANDEEPSVPSTLCGELRPYQFDGFRWLARLSRWGAGGCLADDMGLGKTIQTIALLLHRAPEGPSLVVAPTSVVPTWIDEIARFAPTLRVRVYAGPTRGKELQDLSPFDVVVTSYGILQADSSALETLEFAILVLDEAQAIKNLATKRAQAARRLRAQVRVATTGTPIENRLEDLHSLFSFLNPGLLGSPESFQTRFVRPIEEQHNVDVRDRLRRLVAPFILRRTKTQVLPELPARIETTLRVPLELEEMALYESIREKALAELSQQADATIGKGPGRMRILAVLTRLRLAASNARLVLPDVRVPSAKLAALGELLDDLLPNQHKVLVFSQFVTHLALVKEMLEARGVSFQYLDGETPMAARKAAVDAFQSGHGDVFLISLKAGGFGLHLTAADYVIHMDPWWNPAVENQASDRAHRLGQSRPVTIYRLVASDTIEDRILALHHRKKELAEGILAGSDLAGRMSETELLELIRSAD